jgi:hypothetical protein
MPEKTMDDVCKCLDECLAKFDALTARVEKLEAHHADPTPLMHKMAFSESPSEAISKFEAQYSIPRGGLKDILKKLITEMITNEELQDLIKMIILQLIQQYLHDSGVSKPTAPSPKPTT